jgi:hypothetical protein
MDETWVKAVRRPLLDCANAIKAIRDRLYPEPHILEGGDTDIWRRLNNAQAYARRAAMELTGILQHLPLPPSPGPDEMAELETAAGFTQEADEAISAGRSPAVADWNGLVLHQDGSITGVPAQAATGPAWEWRKEEDQPWRSGGAEPGE